MIDSFPFEAGEGRGQSPRSGRSARSAPRTRTGTYVLTVLGIILMVVALIGWVWLEQQKLDRQAQRLREAGALDTRRPHRHRPRPASRGMPREMQQIEFPPKQTHVKWLTPFLLALCVVCVVDRHHPALHRGRLVHRPLVADPRIRFSRVMSPLYLRCVICERQQADGLLSRSRALPGPVPEHPAARNAARVPDLQVTSTRLAERCSRASARRTCEAPHVHRRAGLGVREGARQALSSWRAAGASRRLRSHDAVSRRADRVPAATRRL